MIDQTIDEGDAAFFTCQATGTPNLNISWYFNGALVEKTNTMKYMISELSLNPTTKNSTLEIMDADSSDIGTYTCNASNILSSDTSSGMLAVDGESVSQKSTILLFVYSHYVLMYVLLISCVITHICGKIILFVNAGNYLEHTNNCDGIISTSLDTYYITQVHSPNR